MSSRIHERQPSSPVERILICHPRLPEKCLNGKSLSEDAGIEEIAQQIFLYAPAEAAADQTNNNNDWREAVQFLGLCLALYTLPSSLKNGETTKEVYLGKSTLIFVPLEQNGEILAAIQIRRGGGNPLAVRQSIEKWHSLFEMFHGGGVLHRLKQKRNDGDDDGTIIDNSNCIYPGLDQWYSLQKEIRKHKTKQSRLSSNAEEDYTKLQEQIDQWSSELEQLEQQLPNESIRQDLASHYNEYFDNLSLVTSRQGGGLRCLVDCIPAPIAQQSGIHTVQSSPSLLSNEIVSKLKTDMQHILLQEAHQPLLFGISTFCLGHLVQLDFFGGNDGGSHFVTGITAETVTTIMGYMASYRIKLQQQNAAHGQANNMTSPLRFGKIASSLAYNYQGHADQPSSSFASQNESPSGGSFLVPPPSFMMSGSEGTNNQSSIAIQNEQVAWAPKLNLSIKSGEEETEQTSKSARVLLYTVADFSFLIFLHEQEQQEGLDLQSDAGLRDMISNVLVSVRNKMDAAVMTSQIMSPPPPTSPGSNKDPVPKPNLLLGEPGVDFILIDRKQHELTLFTERKAVTSSSSPSSKKLQGNVASPRKLFGFMPAPKMTVHPSSHRQDETKAISQSSLEWSVLGLDCRHRLASHLHLDVLLAFDDMMNDIATKKFSQGDNDDNDDDFTTAAAGGGSSSTARTKYVELCTCMTLGWVYGCANEDTELYAFFDNSTYVTVSDVQNAVKRIQNKVSLN
mmetsp:Transcript_42536/g.102878  ORF Transcript_42536/g.102878 Transcript_42536/m.102878 type:complete len:736 (-) Transcript_42536:1748-3955(-)